jgi:hypothetical protein
MLSGSEMAGVTKVVSKRAGSGDGGAGVGLVSGV